MEVIVEWCCGLDVLKDTNTYSRTRMLPACALLGRAGNRFIGC